MRLSSLFSLACAAAWLGSCNGPQQPTATPDAAPASRPTMTQGQPVALTGQSFQLKSFALNANASSDERRYGIYLYPGQRPDSVLVAQDSEPSAVERDRWAKLGAPKTAVSVFQTFQAGAGYYYYAVAKDNQLRVYRKLLEEASPANEHAPQAQWQLFKTFAFFTDGVREVAP